jgi:acetylornithine deacetylase
LPKSLRTPPRSDRYNAARQIDGEEKTKGSRVATIDVARLTAELVAIDSVSGKSNLAVIDYLEPLLIRHDFVVERLEYADEKGVPKFNLVAKKGDGNGGLGFLSHTDTVPGIGWDRDPWTPAKENGRLIGLGSCDRKGPLAATIAAAAAVDVRALKHPIVITATADEETTAQGAIEIVARSEIFRSSPPKYGVIAEPTSLTPVYAHKGGAIFTVTATGLAAHTSTEKGISANFLIAPFLAEMAEYAKVLKSDPSYRNEEFAPPTLGFNLVLDDGGTKPNVTAAKTVATINFRPMPNDRSADVMAHVRERAEAHGLAVEHVYFKPFAIDPGSEIVQAAAQATGAQPKTVSYGSEAAIFMDTVELVLLGPGDIAQAHTKSEFIELQQLESAVGVYGRMIQRLCL